MKIKCYEFLLLFRFYEYIRLCSTQLNSEPNENTIMAVDDFQTNDLSKDITENSTPIFSSNTSQFSWDISQYPKSEFTELQFSLKKQNTTIFPTSALSLMSSEFLTIISNNIEILTSMSGIVDSLTAISNNTEASMLISNFDEISTSMSSNTEISMLISSFDKVSIENYKSTENFARLFSKAELFSLTTSYVNISSSLDANSFYNKNIKSSLMQSVTEEDLFETLFSFFEELNSVTSLNVSFKTINYSLFNCLTFNYTGYNVSEYNSTWRKKCIIEEAVSPPWYKNPNIYFIGGGVISGLINLFILKAICSYCSKYSGDYLPPRHKLPPKRRNKDAWVLRHIDKMPNVTEVTTT